MATAPEVDAVLSRVAGLYGKADAWRMRAVKPWRQALQATPVDELRRAVEGWIGDHADRAPTVAQLLGSLKGARKASATAGEACGLCSDGWRIVTVRYRKVHGGPVEQGERAVACDCPAGDDHGRGPRLAGYLGWIDGGRCDAHGVPCGGELVERLVDAGPARRSGASVKPRPALMVPGKWVSVLPGGAGPERWTGEYGVGA